MADLIDTYSPNTRWGHQHVEVVLMAWGYSAVMTTTVGGNTRGMSVLDAAIGRIYDNLLPEEDGPATVVLTAADGDTLTCEDEEDEGEEWLKEMIVSARIIAYDPPTLNEVRAMNGAEPVSGGDVPYPPQ